MATKGEFWSKKKPADMHGDGVHFNKDVLAERDAKRNQKTENSKIDKKNTETKKED